MIKWVLDKDSDKMWDEMASYIKWVDSLNGLGNQHMRLRGRMMRFKQ